MSGATLWLVRHAESTANAAGILQGWAEYPLSARGTEQARRAALRLAELVVAPHLVASPMERARRTADAIAAATGAAVVEDGRLREYGFGPLTGLTHDEIAARFPDLAAARAAGRPRTTLDGEEGGDAFDARVGEALSALLSCARDAADIVVVAHGGSLDALVRLALGVARRPYRVFSFANASITALRVDDDGAGEPPRARLALLNDTRHLDG